MPPTGRYNREPMEQLPRYSEIFSQENARTERVSALDDMEITTAHTPEVNEWASTARFGLLYSSLAGGVAYALNQRLDHQGQTTLFIMVFTIGFFTSWIRTVRS